MQSLKMPIEVFCSYDHRDERFRRDLETHLNLLQRQGLLSLWHDRNILPGTDWMHAIDTHLDTASLILLLISPDFFASDYCYGIEMQHALERHAANQARVIPILLRPVDWKGALFQDLRVLPTNARPITKWRNRDDAFADITAGIRRAIEELHPASSSQKLSNEVRSHILDRTSFLCDRTYDFVGRHFVLESIDRFLDDNPNGYLLIRGDPGIGKSAIAAHLIVTRGYVHHINIRSEGTNTAAIFLRNICAHLIASYDLPYQHLPPVASENGEFFSRLLNEAVRRLPSSNRLVIIIDALDETDDPVPASGANILYLPENLPEHVYIVATVRREFEVHLNVRCPLNDDLLIEHDSPENVADIETYLSLWTKREGVRNFIDGLRRRDAQYDTQRFVGDMIVLSEGNFMYLRGHFLT